MSAKQGSGCQPTHLVVLLHGVAGSPANLMQLEVKLRHQLGAEALVLVPGVYSLARTWDGVDVCAGRVLRLLRETVSDHPSLRHVSFFGYSFGGLVARYLAGALEVQSPAFLGLTPLNLVTSATPHLGVFLLADAAQRRTAASVSALGGRTGQQLVLRDEQQLLALMCHPDSAFTRGAARFRRRSLYANVANDRTVPFWTAWFAPMNADGRPASPPRAAAQSPDWMYPHIIWEGSAAEADTAPKGEASSSEATESEATMPASAVLPESVEAAQDALSHLNRAKLALLAPLLVLLFPIWLAIVPGTITLLGLYKRHTQRVSWGDAAPPREGSHLMDGRLWSEVMREEGDAGRVQRRMAERLNAAGWHKVAVHFSLSREGLLALHTHGLIVHRRLHIHAPGADVVQHCVDNWALDTA